MCDFLLRTLRSSKSHIQTPGEDSPGYRDKEDTMSIQSRISQLFAAAMIVAIALGMSGYFKPTTTHAASRQAAVAAVQAAPAAKVAAAAVPSSVTLNDCHLIPGEAAVKCGAYHVAVGSYAALSMDAYEGYFNGATVTVQDGMFGQYFWYTDRNWYYIRYA